MNHEGAGGKMRFSDIVIDDAKLSMTAKGVFVTVGLLGSGCKVADLASRTASTDEALDEALQELVEGGYVTLEDGTIHIQGAATFGLPS